MIIALVIWLYKKYLGPFLQSSPAILLIRPFIKHTIMILVLLLGGYKVMAQDQTLNYDVVHNGSTVGHMKLQQKKNGDDTFLKIASEVKMRFIFGVKVNVEEESHYHNGKLVSSHVYRLVNGKEKANKYTRSSGEGYLLIDDDRKGSFNQKEIAYNFGMIYLREPVGVSQIYSDNFQQYVQIKQVDAHSYRIDLPDGNYNFYSYTNGICSKVEVHHSFYKIQIRLT
jgi:hypothetical protein